MLLRGAHYPSFGKPHDGLGYAPQLTNNGHGSTGISGIAFYQADSFPKAYNNCLYVGNPITNRIHRDILNRTGSTYHVDKPIDFLTCDDPWFRPVDIQLGPDGSLYIADFYNKIIGHYEVDLNHPQRDRHRGRIWRIVWKGVGDKKGKHQENTMPDLSTLDAKSLTYQMGSKNLKRRTLAIHEYLDRRPSDGKWDSISDGLNRKSSPILRASCIAVMGQLHLPDDLIKSINNDEAPVVQRQIIRTLIENPEWSPFIGSLVREQLKNNDPFVRRFAADALGRHPHHANVKPLLNAWAAANEKDTFLIHTIRLALRDQLRGLSDTKQLHQINVDGDGLKHLVEISLAVPTEPAAWFTFEYLRKNDGDVQFINQCIEHIAKNLPANRVDDVVKYVQNRFEGDIDKQWSLFVAIQTGLGKRGVRPSADSAMGQWLGVLAPRLFKSKSTAMWSNRPIESDPRSPWGLRERSCTDGKRVHFIDSIVNGEQLTGVLQSRSFTVPKQLTFYMCGHNGHPSKNPAPVNHIRLVIDGNTVAKATPPRHDTARKYVWDLSKYEGKKGFVEIVDADSSDSYAWIGVARFDPAAVRVSGLSSSMPEGLRQAVIKQIGNYKIESLFPLLVKRLEDKDQSVDIRISAATALARSGKLNSDLIAILIAAAQTASASDQVQFARVLYGTRDGAGAMLDSIESGKASPRLLQDRALADRFNRVATPQMKTRAAKLLKGAPSLDAKLGELMAKRRFSFARETTNPKAGQQLFTKHCTACHRIADKGAMIAPNLDGIYNRGASRLIEDLLDPSPQH